MWRCVGSVVVCVVRRESCGEREVESCFVGLSIRAVGGRQGKHGLSCGVGENGVGIFDWVAYYDVG